jgi:hypothetical protein
LREELLPLFSLESSEEVGGAGGARDVVADLVRLPLGEFRPDDAPATFEAIGNLDSHLVRMSQNAEFAIVNHELDFGDGGRRRPGSGSNASGSSTVSRFVEPVEDRVRDLIRLRPGVFGFDGTGPSRPLRTGGF